MIEEYNNFINNLNFQSLCVIFFNLKNIDKKGIAEVSYQIKKSKFLNIKLTPQTIENVAKKLRQKLKINFKINHSISNFYFKIPKNLFDTNDEKRIDNLINDLYSRILNKIVNQNQKGKHYIKEMFVAIWGLRGSPDITGNFFALDIIRKIQTSNYLLKIFFLLNEIDDLNQLNINIREFQKEYHNKINKRNTQLRINLKYFIEYPDVLNELKIFNYLKWKLIDENKEKIKTKNISKKNSNIFERVYKYNKLDKLELEQYNTEEFNQKKQIFFDDKNYKKSIKSKKNYQIRNKKIVDIAKERIRDFCFGCKNKYNVEDRTCFLRDSGKPYLEIHHVISFANGNVDFFPNLVKLCPVCHSTLRKNRASEKDQLTIIESIIQNRKEASKFVEIFIKKPYTLEKKIKYIYNNLK